MPGGLGTILAETEDDLVPPSLEGRALFDHVMRVLFPADSANLKRLVATHARTRDTLLAETNARSQGAKSVRGSD